MASGVGTLMDLLGSFGPQADVIIFFAAGMGVGASLLAALQAALEGEDGAAALARRVARIEMRLAAGKDAMRLSHAMFDLVERLPRVIAPGASTMLAAAKSPRKPVVSKVF